MGNSLGRLFRVTTFGESHGPAVGVIVDGCPPRLAISRADVQADLDRRRPGRSPVATRRREPDRVDILSGVEGGLTLGTPIAMTVRNVEARSDDYADMMDIFRPSHADFTYQAKYGIRARSGVGRASARETVARVAAGAVARRLLADRCGVEIVAWVNEVHGIAAEVDVARVTRESVDASPVRCPDVARAAEMLADIEREHAQGDSVGGVVAAVARRVPAGLGAPVFDRLHADLGKALLSLPAARGFEIGSGFAAARMTGSEHNDPFVMRRGRVRTVGNHSGGVQGGIANGEDIVVRVAFKPPPTIARAQHTVNEEGETITLRARGRHDPCVAPRAVPVVEAMIALVLADHLLRHQGQVGPRPRRRRPA